MHRHLLLILLLAALGCASAIVNPYVGQQQAWPTATGSLVVNRYQLPIYLSLPPKPYEVIGELRIKSHWVGQAEVDHVPLLVTKAKELGADALLLVTGRRFFGTDYGPPAAQPATGAEMIAERQAQTFSPQAFRPDTNILAIRWTRGAPPDVQPR